MSITASTIATEQGAPTPRGRSLPPLENGDRLTREEFERRYDAMPNLKKAELIEGVVFMPSPVTSLYHGRPHARLTTCLGIYSFATSGVELNDNATVRLDLDNEPQPDLALTIDADKGGQSSIDADGYIENAPELVAEIAATSASLDLNKKLHVYRRNRVREYVVWRVLDEKLDWFILRQSQYEPLSCPEGIYRSDVFPGLWIDAEALVQNELTKVQAILQQGLASAEHQAFVARLREARPTP